jgi:predicted unusual protein kinase regulating ubiquinone biosynthesis (AarF/ABC1/UbiB family)
MGHGGASVVVTAIRQASDETCQFGGTVIIKCEGEAMNREAVLLRSFEATRHIYIDTVRRERSADVCIVMRRLGMSLEAHRDARLGETWSWPTVASVGLILLEAVKEFHTGGLAHTDLHVGNVLYVSPDDNTHITPIDVGSMALLEDTAKQTVVGLVSEDLKQVLMSMRFLIDGNRAYFAEKRFDYVTKGREALSGAPDEFRQAMAYVYSIRKMEEVDYARIQALLLGIIRAAGIEPVHGQVLW